MGKRAVGDEAMLGSNGNEEVWCWGVVLAVVKAEEVTARFMLHKQPPQT